MTEKIVLGTRGSDLALRQATLVSEALARKWPNLSIEVKKISTKGDETKAVDKRAGRKGLFTTEIENALLAGHVDIAVHSAKDLPSQLDAQTEISAVLPRARWEDVIVSKHPGGLTGLPAGATVGTGSIRRSRQLKWQRADISIVDLRGNVPTRLRKLSEESWAAIVLARAGLDRLAVSLPHFFIEALPQAVFLPAGGQGIIAIQIRSSDADARRITEAINEQTTRLCLRAEREFLRLLNVDCNAPVGVLATIDNRVMKMRAQYFHEGSTVPEEGEVAGVSDQGEVLAAQLANGLRT